MNGANFHKHGLPLIQEPDLGYYVTHCKLVLQSKHDIIKLYLSGICLSFILMKESPNYELRTRAGRSEQNPIVVQAKTGLQITSREKESTELLETELSKDSYKTGPRIFRKVGSKSGICRETKKNGSEQCNSNRFKDF